MDINIKHTTPNNDPSPEWMQKIMACAHHFAPDGYRFIVMAIKPPLADGLPGQPAILSAHDIELPELAMHISQTAMILIQVLEERKSEE